MMLVKRFIVFAMACLLSVQTIEANSKRLKGRKGSSSHFQYRELLGAKKGGKDDDDAWNSGDGSSSVVEVSVSQNKHDAYVKQHKNPPSLPPQDISASLPKNKDSKPNNVNVKNSSSSPPQPPLPSKPAKGSGSNNKGASNTNDGGRKRDSTQKTSGGQGVSVSKNKNNDPKGASTAANKNPKGLKGHTVPNAGGTKRAKFPKGKKTKDGDGKDGKTTKMDSSGTDAGNNDDSATTGTSNLSSRNGNGKTSSSGRNGPGALIEHCVELPCGTQLIYSFAGNVSNFFKRRTVST